MTTARSRRTFMKLSAGSLLAAGLWPGCARRNAPEGLQPLQFIQVNDLHFSDEKCVPYFEKLVRELNTYENTPLCLIVGDLVDGGTAVQFSSIKSILSHLRMPYKVVIGNHDYLTQTDRSTFLAAYPNSINYTFEFGGFRFVGLDTTDGKKSDGIALPADTLSYAKDTLRTLDKTQPMVLFTHIPLGRTAKMRLTNADATLDLFREHNLLGVFNGHYHGYTLDHFKSGEVTTDKCCSRLRDNHDGTPEKGYFICNAGPAGLTRRFVEFKAPAA